MQGENPTEEPRSELFATVWAYLPLAAEKVREEGETGSEGVAEYIEDVLVPFIERETHAAMVQEGRITLPRPPTQEGETEASG